MSGETSRDLAGRHVIDRAGLRHTRFPDGPTSDGPHARMYEFLWGLLEPPRDHSVYDMSWTGTGAALVSTMDDLNRLYARLLDGRIVSRSSLAQMQRAVPVRALDGTMIEYGPGLHKVVIPGCGTFWGHDGTVRGAGTISLTRADGGRQMSVAVNLQCWKPRSTEGTPRPHPTDTALRALYDRSLRDA
ncbi:serine hydrolase domain-containing protein [Streptomyces sp. NPDC057235]|uniref:serine hydrolase domain-containing protein n=1 Tax=Streptomyces sp. NPDC057235 TaxID=3346058 RepID=UPI00363B034D